MLFTRAVTLLHADDLEPIVDFYTSVLGWSVHGEWRDDGVLKWVMVGPDDSPAVRLMYNVPEDSTIGPIDVQQAVPWVYVNDVAAARSEIETRGGAPGPLEPASGGGEEFSVTDPQGYCIYISQES